MIQRILLYAAALTISIGIAPSAYAYLDPGTGSFLLQMLIAGALGAYLYVKLAWIKTKMFFVDLFSGSRRAAVDDRESTEQESKSASRSDSGSA